MRAGKTLSLMALVVLLVGCGSSKTLVMKPPDTVLRATSLQVTEKDPTMEVPQEMRTKYSAYLNRFFFDEGGYARGSGLTVEYRFIGYNPGSRFTRYMVGPLGGEGSITVQATFFDDGRRELGSIQCEGTIKGGVFGGSIDYALEQSAKELSEYAKKNLLAPPAVAKGS